MESLLAKKLHLTSKPVAILLTDEKPEEALQFQPGTWGCVMAMLKAASLGRTAVFDRETVGCGGGGVGLGFGNASTLMERVTQAVSSISFPQAGGKVTPRVRVTVRRQNWPPALLKIYRLSACRIPTGFSNRWSRLTQPWSSLVL